MLQRFKVDKKSLLALITLAITSLVSFFTIMSPVLHSDDWDLIRGFLFNSMPLVNWSSRRPLEYAGFKILFDLFGAQLKNLYIVQVFLIFLCAVVVYFWVVKVFSRHAFLALPCAMIFLIYPVDYTKVWLIQIYTWEIYLVTLISLSFLFDFAANGSIWKFVFVIISFILLLGAYEAQLGLIIAWSFCLFFLFPKMPIPRKIALAVPFFIGIGFSIWKVFLQSAVTSARDPYLQSAETSPVTLIRRLIDVAPVFIEAWVKPFSFVLNVSVLRLLLVLVGISVGLVGMIWVISRDADNTPGDPLFPLHEKWTEIKSLLPPFGVGTVLLFAGYIPIIVHREPNLQGISSRANLFAILGGALVLSVILGGIAFLVMRTRGQAMYWMVACTVGLVCLGAFQQIWNLNETRIAWRQQRQFWHSVFATVPGMKDHTTLVVIVAGRKPNAPFERLPITAEWEISNGVKVLYNNPTLGGHVIYRDYFWPGAAKLVPEGVQSPDQPIIPYKDAVFVLYDQDNKSVSLVKDLGPVLGLPFPVPNYDPKENITTYSDPIGKYRSFVR